MEFLLQHSWPGNVRELEHTIEHAAIMCKQALISMDNLPADLIRLSKPVFDDRAVSNRSLGNDNLTIQAALEKAGGNTAKAARLLGVSRCTLYNRLRSEDLA